MIIRKAIVPIFALYLFISIANAQTMKLAPVVSNNWNWLSMIKDLAPSLFYLATIILAIIGLGRWKKELKGRSKYEAARNVIAGAYRVRDAINNVRSSYMFDEEWADRKQGPDEPNHETNARNSYYAYMNRYKSVENALYQWYPAIVEAEALFVDEDARKRIESLAFSARRLKAAIDIYHRDKVDVTKSSPAIAEQKVRDPIFRQNSNIVYGIHPGIVRAEGNTANFNDDGFQAHLDSAVISIKEYFQPHIK